MLKNQSFVFSHPRPRPEDKELLFALSKLALKIKSKFKLLLRQTSFSATASISSKDSAKQGPAIMNGFFCGFEKSFIKSLYFE